MPVDEKIIDAICGALADHGAVSIEQRRHYALLDFGDPDTYVMVGSTFPTNGPPRELGPAPLTEGDLMVLVEVCDAYLSLVDAIQGLPGAVRFPDETRARIKDARGKLRARL